LNIELDKTIDNFFDTFLQLFRRRDQTFEPSILISNLSCRCHLSEFIPFLDIDCAPSDIRFERCETNLLTIYVDGFSYGFNPSNAKVTVDQTRPGNTLWTRVLFVNTDLKFVSLDVIRY
jgi:hypothetical protein